MFLAILTWICLAIAICSLLFVGGGLLSLMGLLLWDDFKLKKKNNGTR